MSYSYYRKIRLLICPSVDSYFCFDIDRTLEGDVISDTSGDFREALGLLLSGKRDEPTALQLKNLSEANVHELVNAQLAETDAKEIYENGEGETSGDFKELLLSVVTYALDRPQFFAQTLHASMAGAGTRDSTLMRQLVLRSDLDLESVKRKFEELEGQTLEQWITSDTSGDYQKLCLALATSHNDI
ncbi:unnamed protein product [Schistocephalus solidus]|uniref:Annexin n=1 Tax=Schistocephalus solidus TaxID=70667 RepID=A0A183TB76_SCHSO|nr:unnamed protein product [Schistocephalus solidus]